LRGKNTANRAENKVWIDLFPCLRGDCPPTLARNPCTVCPGERSISVTPPSIKLRSTLELKKMAKRRQTGNEIPHAAVEVCWRRFLLLILVGDPYQPEKYPIILER